MQTETQQRNPQALPPTGGLTIQDAFQLLSVRMHAVTSTPSEAPKRPHATRLTAEASKCS